MKYFRKRCRAFLDERLQFTVPSVVAAIAGLLYIAAPRPVNAQATVSGHVGLRESGRKQSNDISSAFVWLVPLAFTDTKPNTVPKQTSSAMRTREFLPHISVVAAGGLVQFPNEDPFSHNVFSNSEIGRFDLGLYPRRKTRAAALLKPGVYAVYCNIHSRMSSFILAVPTRHVAQVDKNGRFEMRDVPLGEYEFHVWHERAPEQEVRIRIESAGTVMNLDLDARGYVPGPHLNKFGQVYPVTRADRY